MNMSANFQGICCYLLLKITRHSLIFLLSAVLLSESVGATPRNKGLQIAQEPGNAQQDATRAAAEKLSQEGMELYQQGTAESLRQAIKKWPVAVILILKTKEDKVLLFTHKSSV